MYIQKVYSMHYTLTQNTNAQKISFGQNKRYQKCPLFFFHELQLIAVLLLKSYSHLPKKLELFPSLKALQK